MAPLIVHQDRVNREAHFGPEPGVATHAPPIIGKPYPLLVPALDPDGNERCGVSLPFQTVPLATYTGWNLRDEAIGGAGQILSSGGASGLQWGDEAATAL